MSHPDDILIVCWPEEARLYPQFKNKQVFPTSRPEKVAGVHFRIGWYTAQAAIATGKFWGLVHAETYFCDGELKPIEEYKEGA